MTSSEPTPEMAPISARRLNRALLIAVASAALLVTTVVLPAEYGVDPTGAGRLLGLTQMGAIKAAQAGEGTAPAGPVTGDSVTQAPDGTRRVQIVIGPYGGREVKAVMDAGAEFTYAWSTDGEAVEFEFHGDPKVPKSPGEYTSYEKGTKPSASGTFKAGFAGNHGWFWKNLTAKPVTITATVKGAVEKFAPLHAEGNAAATSGGTAAAGGSGSTDTTPYYTDLPMKQFMSDVLSFAASEIWKRQGYISDEKGFRSTFPKNDEEWKEAENASLSLAELTNIMLIPGRRVDEQPWADGVAQVRGIALELAAAARKKDENAFMEVGSELNEACITCHKRYAPGVD